MLEKGSMVTVVLVVGISLAQETQKQQVINLSSPVKT